MSISRRDLFRAAAASAAAFVLPQALRASPSVTLSHLLDESDEARLARWVRTIRAEGLAARGADLGRAVARAGELALGSPYAPGTLDEYAKAGGDPAHEPLAATLARFDCVTLVESCLGVARVAHAPGAPAWAAFERELERMRYRGGARDGYPSRLHYFSEWIADGDRRGLVRDLGRELGGARDPRPLRFMSQHRAAYPALRSDAVYAAIVQRERTLDSVPRYVVPTARIAAVAPRIRSGDVLAFATSLPGLDATHTGLAYRDGHGVLRALHAPLSGGEVQVSRRPLHEYVAGLRNNTGIMVARPLPG
ncbi:MAG TPA: N-acetylmuramoyl-L-alanine amidase-like domain-containing protein [Longimicrobiaceae bacterium]|jgi:hypothetical protein|nr:N-acetylmuramoyl-L-alanine amidase-like domain-containing protein [Longimicrobiaceae bacterium]